MYIVELEKGVWIANWEGDPGRTLKKENESIFQSKAGANRNLKDARKYIHFENAKIKHIDDEI